MPGAPTRTRRGVASRVSPPDVPAAPERGTLRPMSFWSKPTPSPEVLACSFCNKPQREVLKLIAGPGVHICNECVVLSSDILAEDAPRLPRRRALRGGSGGGPAGEAHRTGRGGAVGGVGPGGAPGGGRRRGSGPGGVRHRAHRQRQVHPGAGHRRRAAGAGDHGGPEPGDSLGLRRRRPREPAVPLGRAGGLHARPRSAGGWCCSTPCTRWPATCPPPGSHQDVGGAVVQRHLVSLLDGAALEIPQSRPRHPQGGSLRLRTQHTGVVLLATVDAPRRRPPCPAGSAAGPRPARRRGGPDRSGGAAAATRRATPRRGLGRDVGRGGPRSGVSSAPSPRWIPRPCRTSRPARRPVRTAHGLLHRTRHVLHAWLATDPTHRRVTVGQLQALGVA